MAQQAAQNAFGPRFALIRQEPEKFMIHYGMSVASFDALLTAVKPAISKVNTQMRDCVSAEEKLAATLRLVKRLTLGSGDKIKSPSSCLVHS